MSDSVTKRMLRAYTQDPVPTLFLSGMFQSPPENFHTTEEVEIDIERSDETVSVAISDLSTGYRMNSIDEFTNKGFKPPINKEASPINSFDLLKRTVGSNPFEQPDFRANLIVRVIRSLKINEGRVRRSGEWQASQVLQTGIVTLTDSNGAAVFTIDYKPKVTHFPTVGTTWDNAGADPITDLDGLGDTIRNDGLSDPDQLVFGRTAWNEFTGNAIVQKHFDVRRMDLGTVSSQKRGQGATFKGTIAIGSYMYDMFVYNGKYIDPQTLVKTDFVDPGKVIMRAESGRLDATFGAIPNIGAMIGGGSASRLPEISGRISNVQGGMDLFTNVWISEDGEQLFAGVGTRQLMIPTAIDTYGCLTT